MDDIFLLLVYIVVVLTWLTGGALISDYIQRWLDRRDR